MKEVSLETNVPHYELSTTIDPNSKEVTIQKSIDIEYHPETLELLSTIRYDPLLVDHQPQTVEEITKHAFFLWDAHVQRLQDTLDFFEYFDDEESDKKKKALDTGGRLVSVNPKPPKDPLPDPVYADSDLLLTMVKKAFKEGDYPLSQPYKIRLLVKVDGKARIEIHETPVIPNLLLGLEDNYPMDLMYDVYVDRTPVFPSPYTSFKTTSRKVYNEARKRALPGKSPREEVLLINCHDELMEGSITSVAVELVDGTFMTPNLRSGCLCGVTRRFLLAKNHIGEGVILAEQLRLGHEILMFNGIMGVVRGIIRGFVEPEDPDSEQDS